MVSILGKAFSFKAKSTKKHHNKNKVTRIRSEIHSKKMRHLCNQLATSQKYHDVIGIENSLKKSENLSEKILISHQLIMRPNLNWTKLKQNIYWLWPKMQIV